MIDFIDKFSADESGVTSVEYALLAAAASATVLIAGGAFYDKVSAALQAIALEPVADTGNGSGF